MTSIDPALLQAQYQAMQSQYLPTQATIPSYQPQQQYQPQYAPINPFANEDTIKRLVEYFDATTARNAAADAYVEYLEALAVRLKHEYNRLFSFSSEQDELITAFLHDRDFALDYARGAWIRQPVTNEFMNSLADVYLEIDALKPPAPVAQDPQYTGSPVQFQAQVFPQPNLIPPLPNTGGNQPNGITLDQMMAAAQQGQLGQARASALRDPSSLYAALFQ